MGLGPDGQFIAFIWDDGGVRDLWVVEPGVSLPQKVTSAEKGVYDIAWLPESTKLFSQWTTPYMKCASHL